MVDVLYSTLHGLHIILLLFSLLLLYRILRKTQKRLHQGNLLLFFFVITLVVQHLVFFLNYKKVPNFYDFIIEILNVVAFLLFLLGFWHMQHSISELYLRSNYKGKKR